MSGIRITMSGTGKVHGEGPGEGDSATECGKGADVISGTDEAVDCLACLKVIAKRETSERQMAEIDAERKRFSGEHLGHGAPWCGEQCAQLNYGHRLITGHEASSHSRRGHECRVCGFPVVDHESVDVTESLSVAYWTGSVYGAGTVLNEARVRTVEARKLLMEIEAWQHSHRGDGLFLPDTYEQETLKVLWYAGHVVPGSKTSGPGGNLGWYSVRMITADHEEALRINDTRLSNPLGVCDECSYDDGHFSNCPVMVQADVDARDPEVNKPMADLASLPSVTEQVASIRRNLTGDDLSMISQPWAALRGKRKATKVTRRAWQSKLGRKAGAR